MGVFRHRGNPQCAHCNQLRTVLSAQGMREVPADRKRVTLMTLQVSLTLNHFSCLTLGPLGGACCHGQTVLPQRGLHP